MKRLIQCLLAALCTLVWAASGSAATVISSDPSLNSEIGARIRWAATGFEASLYDVDNSVSPGNQIHQSPTLNPVGTPVWVVGSPYAFQITYDSITGNLVLSLDFDQAQDGFESNEIISRNLFSAPGQTSYAGMGFTYIEISGNESGSTGRSTLSDLTINGASFASISPGGAFTNVFYTDSSGNPMANITITGTLTFTTSGTSQERPSWNFQFEGPQAPNAVPLPSALALLLSGVPGGFGLMYWRRRRQHAAV